VGLPRAKPDELPAEVKADEEEKARNKPKPKAPAHSQCLLGQFQFAQHRRSKQLKGAQAEEANAQQVGASQQAPIVDYLRSVQLRPLRLRSGWPQWHGSGGGRSGGAGRAVFHVRSASNNSVILFDARNEASAPTIVDTSSSGLALSAQSSRGGQRLGGALEGPLVELYSNSSFIAFESICAGWQSSFQPRKADKQAAYWALDRRRGALVAKFDFYSTHEFLDLLGYVAKLSSPLFNPVPPYHFQPHSAYHNSCTISFRSYMTLRAHLELYLLPIARTAAGPQRGAPGSSPAAELGARAAARPEQAAQSGAPKAAHTLRGGQSAGAAQGQPQRQQQESVRIGLLTSSDLRLAQQEGEQAAWRDNKLAIPHLEASLRDVPYRLEFSAMPSVIHPDSIKQYRFLNGVAIANFSMSPQCFGLQVPESEWARLRQEGQHLATYWQDAAPLETSGGGGGGEQGAGSGKFAYEMGAEEAAGGGSGSGSGGGPLGFAGELLARWTKLSFLEQHKTSILFGLLFALVATLLASQWLLCVRARRSPGGATGQGASRPHNKRPPASHAPPSWTEARRKPSSVLQWTWRKLLDLLLPALRCLGCAACCCPQPEGRHRVHSASTSGPKGAPPFGPHNSKQNHADQRNLRRHFDQHELHRIHNNYLRPISTSIFEDVELNVNPNYIPNGHHHHHLEHQLQTGHPNSLGHNHQKGGGRSLGSSSGSARHQQQQQYLGASIRLPDNNPLEPYYIDRKRLTLTKPLGKGAFGEVYQGYLVCHCSDDGKTVVNGDQSEQDDSLESHSLKVAVKTLTDERMSEIDFVREAINMSLVSHRNIVQLLGVCFDEKPLYIVMELMPGGNLKNFLLKNRDKKHSKHSAHAADPKQQSHLQQSQMQQQDDRLKLHMGDLLVFALDIARACDHLQRRHFIHRDLAARNCLLSSSSRGNPDSLQPTNYIQTQTIFPNSSQQNQSTASSSAPLIANEQQYLARPSSRSFAGSPPSALDVHANHRVDLEQVYLNGYANSCIVAKLADFGMTRDVYSNDYYRMGHKELPVRWMPPECLDGVATTKSDVWSFGVFLWELFSMGQMPYQQLLDNHQVIEFIKSRRHPGSSFGQTTSSLRGNNNNLRQATTEGQPGGQTNEPLLQEGQMEERPEEAPPLPPPHDNTPHPIYSIMCACWATNPEERPQFEEIANRLYWCLQMPEVLASSLPCFFEQQPSSSLGAHSFQTTKAEGVGSRETASNSKLNSEQQAPPAGDQEPESSQETAPLQQEVTYDNPDDKPTPEALSLREEK